MSEEIKKQKFEVKQYLDRDSGQMRKDVFVDERLFEYEIDLESLDKARRMGPQYFIAAQRDIQRHFLDSLSDFMGRKITNEEVQEAISTGWISCPGIRNNADVETSATKQEESSPI